MYNSINNNTVFLPNTLHIFTDASIKTLRSGEQIGCAGCILVFGRLEDNNIIERYQINRNTTNNISEAKAVRMGIEEAIKYKDSVTDIRLFSDSQITIFGIRERVFNWKLQNGNYIGSAGTPIKNQDLLIEIITTIVENDLKIELYHQSGHVKYTERELNDAAHVFANSNRIRAGISLDFIKTISTFNNMVDVNSRKKFDLIDHNNLAPNQFIEPIYFNNVEFDKNIYSKLIKY